MAPPLTAPLRTGALEACPAAGERLVLPNGRQLRIRSLGDGERGPIRQLLAQLGPRSWYFRFLSPISSAPDALVDLLARADGRTAALVAEHATADGCEVVALANFAAVDDQHAELGLVVRDDWQRQRVGTALALRLLAIANRRGCDRFLVHALPENAGIRRLLSAVGVIVSSSVSAGVVELTFIPRQAIPESRVG
jgi:GNAT superfamily N-acetyltransferase